MNSSFHAYLFSEKPRITAERKRVKIRKQMLIEDDMKKYWGFYLLKGSTVRLGGCARWPGSNIVVIKGSKDAARCAWLGELDSQEESDEISNEFDIQSPLDEIEEEEATTIKSMTTPNTDSIEDSLEDISSAESLEILKQLNQGQVINYLKKLSNHEVDNILRAMKNNFTGGYPRSKRETVSNMSDIEDQVFKWKLNRDDYDDDNGGEEIDEDDTIISRDNGGKRESPDHLLNTGTFNQKNDPNIKPENSNEEERSSWSSSEEALQNCRGVIALHEFKPRLQCTENMNWEGAELDWYPFRNNTEEQLMHINHTGFYYFIFSNDNERRPNNVNAFIELNKTRFNTTASVDMCNNSTDCELHLSFFSNQHVLVEVPDLSEMDPECETHGYNNFAQCNYIVRAESICRPRGSVYLVFLLLVPVIILMFAYV